MNVLAVHLFVDSGHSTWDHGRRICRCGSVENAKIHQLPETPPEARELDDRRIGERS